VVSVVVWVVDVFVVDAVVAVAGERCVVGYPLQRCWGVGVFIVRRFVWGGSVLCGWCVCVVGYPLQRC